MAVLAKQQAMRSEPTAGSLNCRHDGEKSRGATDRPYVSGSVVVKRTSTRSTTSVGSDGRSSSSSSSSSALTPSSPYRPASSRGQRRRPVISPRTKTMECSACHHMVDVRGFSKPQRGKDDATRTCRNCVWRHCMPTRGPSKLKISPL